MTTTAPATTNIIINGKAYNVTVETVKPEDADLQAPYILTPQNGRGKTWRLLRNEKDKSLLFPISGMSCGNFWLREAGEGELIPVC